MNRFFQRFLATWVTYALAVVLIAAAPNMAAAQLPFTGCGTLIAGVECVLFQADVGGLYVVNTAGFSIGDHVRVVGTLNPSCITVCMQGNGCIANSTMTLCAPSPVEQSTWGKVKALYSAVALNNEGRLPPWSHPRLARCRTRARIGRRSVTALRGVIPDA